MIPVLLADKKLRLKNKRQPSSHCSGRAGPTEDREAIRGDE